MRFAYTYRSSDGQRHMAEVDAENRDAAFAKLRTELGIKPIKVTAAAGLDGGGSGSRRRGVVWGIVGVLGVAGILAVGVWLWTGRGRDDVPYQVMTPQGPVTLSVAAPLARQRIPGDRTRIESAVAKDREPPLFRFAAERWLARYAEPGRQVSASREPRIADGEFRAALREPVRIASTDYTEWVDLKRIVAGMKREMGAYLSAGGTVAGYLDELEKRQKLEISYRERAEQRLGEMLAGASNSEGRSAAGQNHLADAYAYWLKANAQLKAMGIWEIPLPEALRPYQMNLGIDE